MVTTNFRKLRCNAASSAKEFENLFVDQFVDFDDVASIARIGLTLAGRPQPVISENGGRIC